MRKWVSVLGITCISCVIALGFGFKTTTLAEEGDVAINETNFPDSVFREFVKQFDTDGNMTLSKAEIENVKDIDVSDRGISSLKGIEVFTSLTSLDCGYNSLSALDVKKNTELEQLYCSNNQISELDATLKVDTKGRKNNSNDVF